MGWVLALAIGIAIGVALPPPWQTRIDGWLTKGKQALSNAKSRRP